MIVYRNKAIGYLIVLILCLGFIPMPGYANVYLKTEVVTGKVTRLQAGVVELNGNGIFFYPDKEDLIKDLSISIGKVVTLKYYLNIRNKPVNKYVEIALGKNSLRPDAPPRKGRDTGVSD